jgi:hypothetical protein
MFIQVAGAGTSNLGLLALIVLVIVQPTSAFAGVLSPTVSPSEAAWQGWTGLDGKRLPFESEEDILEFLRTAEVVSVKNTQRGVNQPQKVLLEKDGIRMNAVFREVDIFKAVFRDPRTGPKQNFRDFHAYESAAYELSRLIGLNRVPPAVPRTMSGRDGTLQAWVENAMVELDRQKQEIEPPNAWRWMMQSQLMAIFDQLIGNDDRNQGNLLIDGNWTVWLIDHTRAFRTSPQLPKPDLIRYCERSLWKRLQSLDETEISKRISPYLNAKEQEGVLKRRAALVKHIQQLIDERGEGGVLFAFPQAPPVNP